jgi:hypothetical protein
MSEEQADGFEVCEHALFATRLMTIQFPPDGQLHADLARIFDEDERFQGEAYFAEANRYNLLQLDPLPPALVRARDLFVRGLRRWARSERVPPASRVDMTMFPLFITRPGQMLPPHNHTAHVTGVYYVRTEDPRGRPIATSEPDSYWDPTGGALLLHDPRFNSSLMQVDTNDDFLKITPRPGLMVLMPGYLWHTVGPSDPRVRRLSLTVNFTFHFSRAKDPPYTFEI